ncbi:unnamed protein product, partial [Tetraodon nigroviridis]
KDGDIILGGIFSFHSSWKNTRDTYVNKPLPLQCISLNFRGFQFAQAMLFAIDEINNSSDLLPALTLGYKIYDACGSIARGVKVALALANSEERTFNLLEKCSKPAKVQAILGETSSSPCMAIATVIGPFYIPLVPVSACSKKCPPGTRKLLQKGKPVCCYDCLRCADGEISNSTDSITCERCHSEFWSNERRDRCIKKKEEFLSYEEMMGALLAASSILGTCVTAVVMFIFFKFRQTPIVRANNSALSFLLLFSLMLCFLCSLTFIGRPSDWSCMLRHTAFGITFVLCISEIRLLAQELHKQNITGLQWVGSDAWITDHSLTDSEGHSILVGSLGFTVSKAKILGLEEHLRQLHPAQFPVSRFMVDFWEDRFDCSLNATGNKQRRPCNSFESLQNDTSLFTDETELRFTNNVYKSVYAVAHALDNLMKCEKGEGSSSNGGCADPKHIQPWQILQRIKKIHFKTKEGDEVYFNENGDPPAKYEIINWQPTQNGIVDFVTVGLYDASLPAKKQLKLQNKTLVWAQNSEQVPVSACSKKCPPGTRKLLQKGKPVCCYDCLRCADGEISNSTDSITCERCHSEFWSNERRDRCIKKKEEFLSYEEMMGALLAASSILGTCVTAVVMFIFFKFRQTPIVRANNSALSFLLLFSLMLCFLCSLTFIGRPSDWSCMLRHTAFGITFVLCISCVLGKTMAVLMAFRATLPGSHVMKWFGPAQQRVSVLGFTLIQVFICILWLTISPPFPFKNIKDFKDRIILECALGSAVGFWVVLGYIGLLAMFCFILAFLARKLPDNFNEAKFITFSMLIFCAVWVTFIPAYVSSPGKFSVAVEIFAILSSGFGLLICIFLPKCYIILLKPERNSKKNV